MNSMRKMTMILGMGLGLVGAACGSGSSNQPSSGTVGQAQPATSIDSTGTVPSTDPNDPGSMTPSDGTTAPETTSPTDPNDPSTTSPANPTPDNTMTPTDPSSMPNPGTGAGSTPSPK